MRSGRAGCHPSVGTRGYKSLAATSNGVVTNGVTARSRASVAGLEANARTGDAYAFGQLIAQWDNELRGVAWSVVRSAPDTDDVMQRSYEKAFRTIGSFRSDASLKTWLHSICYRTAIDHVRYESRRRHDAIDSVAELGDAGAADQHAIAKADLAAVLEQLEPQTRALLMLTAGLGYSFDEAAEIAGMPRGTVASKVGRAKRTLRARQSATRAGPEESA